jgi:hypothetical protein
LRQIPARREHREIGSTGIDVRLLDQHQADALVPAQPIDLALRMREGRRVPSERTHAGGPAKDAAEPLQIEHEAVHRKAIRPQRTELVLELCPVVESELRHPETEDLPGRHGRSAHEPHITAMEGRGRGAGQQIATDRVARHRHPPGIAGEIPRLCVELIDEQGVALARAAECVQDRKLRVLGEPSVERDERVACLRAGRDDPAEQIAVGGAGRQEMLPESVDVLRVRPRHREDVAITADGRGAERGHARRRLVRPIHHVQAQRRGVDPEEEDTGIEGVGADEPLQTRPSRVPDHRRGRNPFARGRLSAAPRKLEVDHSVVEDLDGQARVTRGDLERRHVARHPGVCHEPRGCGDDESQRRDQATAGWHRSRLPRPAS